jgi:hypothetical protein
LLCFILSCLFCLFCLSCLVWVSFFGDYLGLGLGPGPGLGLGLDFGLVLPFFVFSLLVLSCVQKFQTPPPPSHVDVFDEGLMVGHVLHVSAASCPRGGTRTWRSQKQCSH